MKPEQTINDIQYQLIEKLRARIKELEINQIKINSIKEKANYNTVEPKFKNQ